MKTWNTTVVSATVSSWKEWPNTNTSIRTGTTPCCGMQAPQYRTNLSVSGGNARARYYVSFSYLRQEGLFDTKWTEWNEGYSTQEVLNRYNLRSNIDIDVNKFLNVSMDLGGRIDNISQPGIDV